MKTVAINKITGCSTSPIMAPIPFFQPVDEFRTFTNEMKELHENIEIMFSFQYLQISNKKACGGHHFYYGDIELLRNVYKMQLGVIERYNGKFLDAYFGFGDDECHCEKEFKMIDEKFVATNDEIFDGKHPSKYQLLSSFVYLEKGSNIAKGKLLFYVDKKVARKSLQEMIEYEPRDSEEYKQFFQK